MVRSWKAAKVLPSLVFISKTLHHPKWQDFPAQLNAALPEKQHLSGDDEGSGMRKLVRSRSFTLRQENQRQVMGPSWAWTLEFPHYKRGKGLFCCCWFGSWGFCFCFFIKCTSLISTNTFLRTVWGKQNSLEEFEQLLTFPSVQVCTERRLQTADERELCFSI